MMRKAVVLGAILLFVLSMPGIAQEIDLIEKASEAQWKNSAGQEVRFGLRQESVGIAKYEQDVILEDGKQYKRVLLTHPQGRDFGVIMGVFPNISVPDKGGKLIVAGGFIQGAQRTDGVKFMIQFKRAGEQEEAGRKVRIQRKPAGEISPIASGALLSSFDARYNGKIDRIEYDLSQYAGQTGDIILVVQAGQSSAYDWAVWTEAKLVFGDKIGEKKGVDLYKTLSGHNSRIYSADFSPNGKYVVTASGDNSAKIWEVATGAPVATLRGHPSHVFSARFSPNSRQVITAGGEIAKLWNVPSGTEIRAFKGHSNNVHSAEFSPDGAVVVTGSEDGTVKLWNAQNGQEIRTIEVTKKGWVYDAAFSPNGRTLAIGAANGLAGLWNVSNGQQIQSFDGHNRAISSVSFSQDGRFLATSSIDNTTRIWEVSSGRLMQTLRGEDFREVNFSPDGKYTVTASAGGVSQVWRVRDGEQILTIEHSSAAMRVLSATFSQDGEYIVTAGDDQTAKIWRINLSE
jgi:WD40 repeat protein